MTRRVLITGANKGIGKATVEAALSRADDVYVLLGSRSLERGEQARSEIIDRHPDWADRLEVLKIDVSDNESVAAALDTFRKEHGDDAELFGIVNNAGIGRANTSREILEVNTWGPRRVYEAFSSHLRDDGRIVNVSSASGPNYVADCDDDERELLTNPEVTLDELDEYAEARLAETDADSLDAYGLSKALLNAYTLVLARELDGPIANACTPGFIETDMTRRYAEQRGVSPEEMGMKSPEDGCRSSIYLLLGEVESSGWYYGSDAERSPLDRYRSPGDPPYEGE